MFAKFSDGISRDRLLGTPNEETWPGVSTLPDYKSSFPQWAAQDLAQHVEQLDEDGIEFLHVSRTNSSPNASTEYNLCKSEHVNLRYSSAHFRYSLATLSI